MEKASPRRRSVLKAVKIKDRNLAVEGLESARLELEQARLEIRGLEEALRSLEVRVEERPGGCLVSAGDLEADVALEEKLAGRKRKLREEIVRSKQRELRAKTGFEKAQEQLARAVRALEAVSS